MTAPFGGEACSIDAARIALLPVPYEKTTTYGRGTASGPAALLAASQQVETFDEEMRVAPLEQGVATLEPLLCDAAPDQLAARLLEIVGEHRTAGRIVGCLGGEHSLSLGPIEAAARAAGRLGVLQIDAHPDLRDEYEGTRFGHGCVMRRVLELPGIDAIVPVGLRAVSEEDDEVLRNEERVRPFYAFDLARRRPAEWVASVIDSLPERVYVSFDVDGLDPAVMPGTGTPEPGGLDWWEAVALLRAVCEQREVVGFDVVELAPIAGSHVSEFAAARLVMKLLAYLAAGA